MRLPGLNAIIVSERQGFRATHCPVEHHGHLLHLIGRIVHDDPEEVQVAVEVVAVEAGMRVEEQLQQPAKLVHLAQRVVLVGQLLDELRVVALAREAELVDEASVMARQVTATGGFYQLPRAPGVRY